MCFQFQQRVKQRLQQPIKHSWEKAALIGFGIVFSPVSIGYTLLKIDDKQICGNSNPYLCREKVIVSTICGSVILSGTSYFLRKIYKDKLKPAYKTSTSMQNGLSVAFRYSMVFTIAVPLLALSWSYFREAKDQYV